MKKFWVFSDLHLEIDYTIPFPIEAEDADAIVIAGDLTCASKISKTASELIEHYDLPIIFVAGNHEFYKQSSYREAIQNIRNTAEKSITENWKQTFHFLNRDELIFGDTRILGATLWVDMAMAMGAKTSQDRIWRLREAQFALNDFRQIKMDSRLMRPADMIELCRRDTQWLREQLQKPFDGQTTVVISHHMPHPACTPDIYRDDKHNYLFANSEKAFDDILNDERLAPDLWICGHTHQAFDIDIGFTRVVCNPHGYENEFGMNGFEWDKVIDLDDLSPRPPTSGFK